MTPKARTTSAEGANTEDQSPFQKWTGDRILASIGTNYGSQEIAFQQWMPFKESFAPELVRKAVASSKIRVQRLLDPFGGSGTTALASQFLGIRPTTVEVNPFLADVIEAKLQSYVLKQTSSEIQQLFKEVATRGARHHEASHLPATFVEPGHKSRWLFSRDLYDYLAGVVEVSKSLSPPSSRLVRVCLGGVLTRISNVRVSGKGRRYRGNWANRQTSVADAIELFSNSLSRALADIETYGARPELGYQLIRGDARTALDVADRGLDLTVFSPPYPNSFDYTDVYNVELWMLGYLQSKEENTDLRRATLSSHVQVHRVFEDAPPGSSTLEMTMASLRAKEGELWNPHIPSMVGSYFSEMRGIISKIHALSNPGAQLWMVVGDSKYANTVVPVATILRELSESVGFTVTEASPFRSMRTSPQQGGALELPETLLILEVS